MTTTTKPLTMLAARILCSLPKSPTGVTLGDLRAVVVMDANESCTRVIPLQDALAEIKECYGLERTKCQLRPDSRRKTWMYALPADTWARAYRVGQTWWHKHMGVQP